MTTATQPVLHQPDFKDFRDHIPTADQKGRRLWVFAKRPNGAFYRGRTWLSVLLLALLFGGPFIRIGGNPLLMLNVLERKFVIFGQIFWPQDLFILAIAMITGLVMIVLFTATYGRVWCGWLCPQTVLMEMVFRKIEYAIEGDAHQQRQLDSAPWSAAKLSKKALKHAIFFALSFLIGNVLLSYIIGSHGLIALVTDNPLNHLSGLGAMILFTLVFYGIFARFREQACTFVCPYGRFQSVLLDPNSIVVAYDHRRGDPRQKADRNQTHTERRAAGIGDCINCGLCVSVCPTGIDIRNGTQMECVHCTACIDACDSVMSRLSFPKGLIRYASENGINRGERLKLTPRIVVYTAILFVLGGLLTYLLVSRSDVEASLLRAPGALYQPMPNGNLSNLYLLKFVNKTSREVPVELRIESPPGSVTVIGSPLAVKSEALTETAAVVELPPASLTGKDTRVRIGVYADGKRVQTIKTNFIGPEQSTP
ncbi:MAG: cytochrome c oxidase accessory protein CcoG [Lentisphaerae bacterium]|nr:cytochrome c oxidase accessory protein CcoG [Lentisphaerota bacterium]